MATLYILCGPSGCGKTTWAREFMSDDEDVRYVSRDEIRFSMLKEDEDYFAHEKEVFRKFSGTIAQTLIDGFDAIADATHLNETSRKKLTRAIDEYTTDYSITYVVFYTPIQKCYENDATRTGIRYVGEQVIQGMFRSFKAPTLKEDARAIKIIEVGDGKGDFSYLIEPYRKETENG